jgi:hypothetical protein
MNKTYLQNVNIFGKNRLDNYVGMFKPKNKHDTWIIFDPYT